MGCSSVRNPQDRFTTHPAVAEAIIRVLQDCGAVVSLGDDVARAGKHCEHIWSSTGMRDVAKRTGATLIDFVSPDMRNFGWAIADIHRAIPVDLSFLDLTSVIEGHGASEAVRSVGLMLASTDPGALDTVAAHTIGYQELPIWPTYYGGKLGLGCNDLQQINIRGFDWASFKRPRLRYPLIPPAPKISAYSRITLVANKTVLRPRPVINPTQCSGCKDCVTRCPVHCIQPGPGNLYYVNLSKSVDCRCCLKVCEVGAVQLEFVGMAKVIRQLTSRRDYVDCRTIIIALCPSATLASLVSLKRHKIVPRGTI